MKSIIYLTVSLAIVALAASGEQQRILRRVIKSTPTATNLGRIRLITVRSATAEKGNVAEISSKEAATFGERNSNETVAANNNNQQQSGAIKSKQPTTSIPTSTPTTPLESTTGSPVASPSSTTTSTTTSTTAGPGKTKTPESVPKNRASERQQTTGGEVELLSSAPSSWQSMTAVEAPAAMLIATGTRAALPSNDLSSSSSNLSESSADEQFSNSNDFLRASSSTKGASYTQQSSIGETFSRLRQQQQATKQTSQTFFYPQQQQLRVSGKTNQQATKTAWYQTTTTTPRPAPIIQEQQYEQQNEQYVEQQQEYGAAPLGQAEPFAFDFKTQDNSGNGQYRKEESDKNGVVRGSYGYTDANGIYRHVEYVADQNGFRANIKSNEPGLIGETQPASIQYASGQTPSRLSAAAPTPSVSNDNSGEWAATSASNNQPSSADLALVSPDFESSHKPERLRLPRHFRN